MSFELKIFTDQKECCSECFLLFPVGFFHVIYCDDMLHWKLLSERARGCFMGQLWIVHRWAKVFFMGQDCCDEEHSERPNII